MNKSRIALEFGMCVDKLRIRMHHERMERKQHTHYCMIERFSEYINQELEIDNVRACTSHFGCDFLDYQYPNMISDKDYERLLSEPCTYFNVLHTHQVNTLNNLNSDGPNVLRWFDLYEHNSLAKLINEQIVVRINVNMCIMKNI